MKPRRVTLLVSQLGFGGAELQSYELLRALTLRGGFELRCLCLSEQVEPYGEMIRALGIPLEIIPRRSSFDFARLGRLRRALAASECEILHCIHYLAAGYGYLARLGRSRPHFLPSLRSTVVRHGRSKAWVYRRMLAHAPAIIVNSHRGAAYVREHFGADPGRLRIIDNGLRLDELRRRAAEGHDLREELGLAPETPLVGFIGKDAPVKRVDRFVALCQQLMIRRPDAHFVLVGWRLDEKARARLNLENARFHLLGPRGDVPRILRSLDLLVMTSDSEGCPNLLIEAAAIGTPALAPDVGDCERILAPIAARAITPKQDLATYLARAEDLLEHGLTRKEKTKLERWAREHYSLNTMVEATIAVYTSLTESYSASSGSPR